MKERSAPRQAQRPAPPSRPLDYADLLAAYEARRRAADDVLVRTMVQVREPMNPRLGSRDDG